MTEMTPDDNLLIEFGHGRFLVDRGHFGGTPAVFISPLLEGEPIGRPGEKAPPRALNWLVAGEIVLTFPSIEQRNLVYHSLLNELPPPQTEAT